MGKRKYIPIGCRIKSYGKNKAAFLKPLNESEDESEKYEKLRRDLYDEIYMKHYRTCHDCLRMYYKGNKTEHMKSLKHIDGIKKQKEVQAMLEELTTIGK